MSSAVLSVLEEPVVVDVDEARAAAAGCPPAVAGRIERLRASLDAARVDVLVVGSPANVRYLTGFTGSAGTLVVDGAGALLSTDGRYRTQVAEQLASVGLAEAVEVVVGGADAQRQSIAARVASVGRGIRVGLEADQVSWAAARRWTELLAPADVVPTSGVVEALRTVKDAGELARMALAAAVADAALAEVLDLVAPGRTEQDVAAALDAAMRRLGAEDRAFETIVASGPNSAKPHHRPGTRALGVGDLVVVDFGATVEGYRSDMTRTFAVGSVADELVAVHQLVAASQAAGVGAVRPGVATGEIDAVCRSAIADAGYGDAFEHGTGHGVGLDIHEAPAVSAGATAILCAGVVVTVEPGVYLAGVGGVRIEDTVVVTDDGCRPLTRFPKEPVLVRT